MLPLHAGGLIPLLDETRLVNDAHTMRVSVPLGHPLLEPVPHRRFVPAIEPEKLLQSSRRRARGIRHRLNALALQRAQLTQHIRVQVTPGGDPPEAPVKFMEVLG